MISVRKLVALDIFLHGPRFIMIEFGVGTPGIIVLGLLVAHAGQQALGAYLVLTGLNYIPLLAYAITIARTGTASKEIAEGMTSDSHYVRRYSTQQLIIFIPLAVVRLALWQELNKENGLSVATQRDYQSGPTLQQKKGRKGLGAVRP